MIVGQDLRTLQRYANKISFIEETKKVILDLSEEDYSIQSTLDTLVTKKNDLVADIDYLAQTVEY